MRRNTIKGNRLWLYKKGRMMNGNKYLPDTNIILYMLSGDRTITEYLHLKENIIAATAISLNLTLITADKQFKQVDNLLLELYEY